MAATLDTTQRFGAAGASVVLSAGDVVATLAGATYGGVAGNPDTQKSSGKWYWETVYRSPSSAGTEHWGVGIVEIGSLPTTFIGDTGSNSYGFYENGAVWFSGVNQGSPFSTLNEGDVVQHFLDLDASTYEIAINDGPRHTVTTTLAAATYAPAITVRQSRIVQASLRQQLQSFDAPTGYSLFETPQALFAIDADQYTTTASINANPNWAVDTANMTADLEAFLPAGPAGERWFNSTPLDANLQTIPFTILTPNSFNDAREIESHHAFVFADNHEFGRFLLMNTINSNTFGTVNLILEPTAADTDPYDVRLRVTSQDSGAAIIDEIIATDIEVDELVHFVVRARSIPTTDAATSSTGAIEAYVNGFLVYQNTAVQWSSSTTPRAFFNDGGSRILYSGTNTSAAVPTDGRAYIKNPIFFDQWSSPDGTVPPFFLVDSAEDVQEVDKTYYVPEYARVEVVRADAAVSTTPDGADLEVAQGDVSTSITPRATSVELAGGTASTSITPRATSAEVVDGSISTSITPRATSVELAQGHISLGIDVDAVFYLQAPPVAARYLNSPTLGLL